MNVRADGCDIFNKKPVLVATANLINCVYRLNMPVHLSAAAVVSSEVWHRRLGHVNSAYLNKMQEAVESFNVDQKVVSSSWVTCCERKQNLLHFPCSGNKSTQLLELIYN